MTSFRCRPLSIHSQSKKTKIYSNTPLTSSPFHLTPHQRPNPKAFSFLSHTWNNKLSPITTFSFPFSQPTSYWAWLTFVLIPKIDIIMWIILFYKTTLHKISFSISLNREDIILISHLSPPLSFTKKLKWAPPSQISWFLSLFTHSPLYASRIEISIC